MRNARTLLPLILLCVLLLSCQAGPQDTSAPSLSVLATTTFLADIAQNVAGERLTVSALLPDGIDPHSFEPTPKDVARVAKAQVLIVNGGGLEEYLQELLANAGGQRTLIEASAGLTSRAVAGSEHESDPHFWLDPNNVVKYVENIRDGLSQADPAGADVYARGAAAYIAQLKELDKWIQQEVAQIPPERRLLVTNHESFGYFADRYGFRIVGTVIPSVSTGSSPSAQQLARLADEIKRVGVPAIFLEDGTNPKLAEQLAKEAGVRVVTQLRSHSIADAGSYLEMMRRNTQAIVEALK